jgi:hypothetical protein
MNMSSLSSWKLPRRYWRSSCASPCNTV